MKMYLEKLTKGRVRARPSNETKSVQARHPQQQQLQQEQTEMQQQQEQQQQREWPYILQTARQTKSR